MSLLSFFFRLKVNESKFLRESNPFGNHSLVKMSEEVCKIEIAQRGMRLRGSLRIRREERVRD